MQSRKISRVATFDFIRVVALCGILVCHSCFESSDETITGFGRYLGATFNFLFLILSAFLLGATWERKGCPTYKMNYIGKRIGKLCRSYYPYLAVLFVFLYLSQDYFSWRKIISHLLFLPWFDKIDGYGHLWFLTMIAICYIGCCLLTKMSIYIKTKLLIYSLLMGGGICADYIVDSIGLPGFIFPYLIGYLIVFRYANIILRKISVIPAKYNILQAVIINSISIRLFVDGLFDSNTFISYLLGMVSATSLFMLLYGLFKNMPPNRTVEWLSGISFEIYLVHEFFLGRYSVYSLFPNAIIGFLALIAFSTIAALLIKQFWSILSKSIKYIPMFN